MKAKNQRTGQMQQYWTFAMDVPNSTFVYKYYWYDKLTEKWNLFYEVDPIAEDHIAALGKQQTADVIRNVACATTAAMVAAPAAIYAGTSGALYQGVAWAGRNYGISFIKEASKEVLANRGNISNVDWFDIGLGTVTSKMGGFGKLLNARGAASIDLTIGGGFKSGFDGSKEGGFILLDGIAESFKILGGEIGDAGSLSEMAKDGIEVGIDQVRTEVGEMIDKANESTEPAKPDKDGGLGSDGGRFILE